MKCPSCDHSETRVTDSRAVEEGGSIRRRRECLACHRRFTTYESIEHSPLIVIKRSGRREHFDRQKLLNGIVRACDKRFVTAEQMDSIVHDVEKLIRCEGPSEIKSERIGEAVLETLLGVDEVAYIRFASVYRKFDSVDSFFSEIRMLQERATHHDLGEEATEGETPSIIEEGGSTDA